MPILGIAAVVVTLASLSLAACAGLESRKQARKCAALVDRLPVLLHLMDRRKGPKSPEARLVTARRYVSNLHEWASR